MRAPWRGLLALVLVALVLLAGDLTAAAAEVLQVRGGTQLLVGDHNRTYSVELACVQVPADGDAVAAAWLRRELPRRTRVNLRPQGSREGTLVARVSTLAAGAIATDLSDGLIEAGLASPAPFCQA